MIDGRRGRAGSESRPPETTEGSLPNTQPAAIPPAEDTIQASARPSLGRFLARHGVTANEVTVAGLFLAAATGAVIALGHLWLGVALVTAGGLMDTLDGAVAKAAGSSSRRGAFLDSVSDRVADGFMFAGLAWYLAAGKTPGLALLPLGILAVGNVISYERAKAETFGWVAKGGLMERAERLIGLAVALAFNIVLVPLLFALLGLCVFTALQRFFKVWRQATAELRGEPVPARPAPALAAWRPARVESRWLEWRQARASDHAAAGRPRVRPTSRSRRRGGVPLSSRLRSVLEPERASLGGERSPRTSRLTRRRSEGAAAALRRRLGAGR